MKLLVISTLFLLIAGYSQSQDCERIVRDCEELLTKNLKGGGEFISDGQVYTAFLDREKAEFKTTFFGGTTYRVAASAGSKDDFVIFTIRDPQGNILFLTETIKTHLTGIL